MTKLKCPKCSKPKDEIYEIVVTLGASLMTKTACYDCIKLFQERLEMMANASCN